MIVSVLSILALGVVSAVGFRIRGGVRPFGYELPNTVSRLCWAIPVAIGAAVVAGNPWVAIIAPTLFAACTVPTFKAIDQGRNEGTVLQDAFWNCVRGMIFSVAAALPLWAAGIVDLPRAVAILGIGIFMPVMYEIGWRTPSKIKDLEQGAAIAEAYWGGFYGLALAACLVRL